MPAVQLIKNRTLLWQVVIPVLGSFFMWMLLMYPDRKLRVCGKG